MRAPWKSLKSLELRMLGVVVIAVEASSSTQADRFSSAATVTTECLVKAIGDVPRLKTWFSAMSPPSLDTDNETLGLRARSTIDDLNHVVAGLPERTEVFLRGVGPLEQERAFGVENLGGPAGALCRKPDGEKLPLAPPLIVVPVAPGSNWMSTVS